MLEVLVPCCCGNKLFRTKARVLVNLKCFCGIEIVATSVFDYLQLSHVTRDQFCLPFLLTKKDSSKTLCRIDRKDAQHTATISVYYDGTDPQVELTLYTYEEIITLLVRKGVFKSITVSNVQSIEIATPVEPGIGVVPFSINLAPASRETVVLIIGTSDSSDR